jgi:hypothetical protein
MIYDLILLMQGGVIQKKSFFKEMDMFGERVIFTFNGKSTMKSGTGFFSTVVLFIIAVVMFVFMGQSFLLKVDPQSTTSIFNLDAMPYFNTTYNKMMFVALRLRTGALNLKFDGKYFDLYVFKNYRALDKQELYLIECSKLAGIDKNYIRKYNLNDFYCIPLNFENFGGPATAQDNNYVALSINPCYNRTTTCNVALANIISSGSNPLFIDLYYPEVFYDPNNFENPIRVEHSLVTDKFQSSSTVNRELYLKTSKMNDDLGWIFRDNTATNYTSVGQTVVTKSFKTFAHDPIYYLDIFPGVGYEEFTRKYQKFQDVLAVVGGFIKICQIALGAVIFYYVKYLKSEFLINGLINWQNNSTEDCSKNKVMNLIDELKVFENKKPNNSKKFNTHMGMSEKIDFKSLKMKDDKDSVIKNLDQSAEFKNENTEFFLGKFVLKPKLEMKKVSTPKVVKSKTSGKHLQIPLTTGIPFRYQLTLGELFKKNICKRLLNAGQKVRVDAFELADNYVRELLDVFGYLNLVLDVKNLKNVLFNPSQKACFNFVERPTFTISENMNEKTINAFRNIIYNSSNDNELEKKKIAEYFAYNIYSESVTHLDEKLLSGLNQDVLKVISTRLGEMRDSLKENRMFRFNEELLG